jgi:hypothetical protein
VLGLNVIPHDPGGLYQLGPVQNDQLDVGYKTGYNYFEKCIVDKYDGKDGPK